MSETKIKPVSRKSDLVTQEIEKEILIYDLLIDKAFSLNETSSLIWNLCDGENSVSEIAESLSKKLNSPISDDFVRLALEQLKKDNLLENGEEIAVDFGNFSRRDVIRKIGFATLAALPTIAVLVAPTAAQTASTCAGTTNRANGCVCQGANNCASNCCGRTPQSTNACVTSGQDVQNSPCRANCECASNSCNGTTNRCN